MTDESASDGAAAAVRSAKIIAKAEGAVAAALDEPAGPPIVNTHSTALAGEFSARAESFKAMAGDLDAKIALLVAEREDVMLAYSMLSHGMTARERGSK